MLSETAPSGQFLSESDTRATTTASPRPSPSEVPSLEALFKAHHRAVLAYCARRAAPADAWDAASDVFVVASRRIDDLPPVDEARPWLYGVAYRVLANQRRGTQRRQRLDRRVAGTSIAIGAPADEPILRAERERQAIEALERLAAADREIIRLSLWEELNPAQIASVLGISRNAVDQRYSRAKKRLAKELDAITSTRATRPTDEGGAP